MSISKNLSRIDPAIREVIQALNEKGYRTYSSCSGGHVTDLRRKRQRHIEGYIAFSPPSRVAFDLYFTLQGHVEEFQLMAAVGILDEDNSLDQTAYSEIRWQLDDARKPKRDYYDQLFTRLKDAVQSLPGANGSDNRAYLKGLVGERHLNRGMGIVDEQTKRFR